MLGLDFEGSRRLSAKDSPNSHTRVKKGLKTGPAMSPSADSTVPRLPPMDGSMTDRSHQSPSARTINEGSKTDRNRDKEDFFAKFNIQEKDFGVKKKDVMFGQEIISTPPPHRSDTKRSPRAHRPAHHHPHEHQQPQQSAHPQLFLGSEPPPLPRGSKQQHELSHQQFSPMPTTSTTTRPAPPPQGGEAHTSTAARGDEHSGEGLTKRASGRQSIKFAASYESKTASEFFRTLAEDTEASRQASYRDSLAAALTLQSEAFAKSTATASNLAVAAASEWGDAGDGNFARNVLHKSHKKQRKLQSQLDQDGRPVRRKPQVYRDEKRNFTMLSVETSLQSLDPTGEVMAMMADDWLERGMDNSVVSFASIALFCEMKLREGIRATEALEAPNVYRTAIACALFHKLCEVSGSFGSVLTQFKDELLSSIYFDYDPNAKPDAPFSHFRQHMPYFLQIRRLMDSNTEYAQAHQNMIADVKKCRVDCRVAQNSLASWQRATLTASFLHWHSAVKECRKNREKLIKVFESWGPSKAKSFYRWVAFHEQCKKVKMNEAYVSLSDEKATLNLELEMSQKEVENLEKQNEDLRRQVVEAEQSASKLGSQIVRIKELEQLYRTQRDVVAMMGVQTIQRCKVVLSECEKQPDLTPLLEPNESMSQFLALDAEAILLRWVNHKLAQAEHHRTMQNFSSHVRDSENLIVLLAHLQPVHCSTKILKNLDLDARAAYLVEVLDAVDCSGYVLESDIVNGNTEIVQALVAALFLKLHSLEPNQPEVKEMRVLVEELEKMVQLSGSADEMTVSQAESLSQMTLSATKGLKVLTALNAQRAHDWEFLREHIQLQLHIQASHRLRSSDEVDGDVRKELDAFSNYLTSGRIEPFIPEEERETLDEVVANLQNIIRSNAAELRDIFQHYAGTGKLNQHQYSVFVSDAQLVSKALSQERVDEVFGDARAEDAEQALLSGSEPSEEISKGQFALALVALANTRNKAIAGLPARLLALLDKNVLKNACRSSAFAFRSELNQEDIRRVFRKYKDMLEKTFKHFASLDVSSHDARQKLITLNEKEYFMFLKEMQLLDNTFSQPTAKLIFSSVQSAEIQFAGGDAEEPELVYQEFVEAIVAICIHRSPSPYHPLSWRLDTFLRTKLLPLLKSKFKINIKDV